MAHNSKKMSIWGITGLAILALVILTVQSLPLILMHDTLFMPGASIADARGLLIIKVKDAPKELEELFIQIDGVRVHRVTDDSDEESPWMDVNVVETEPFDLLKLTDFSIVLATEGLPTGNYTEIRLHVLNAYANISDNIEELKVVANGWLMVKVHFMLEEEGVTTLTLDIDVNEKSIVNSKKLHPVVKATVEEEKGIGKSKPVQTYYRWADDTEESYEWLADQNESLTEIDAAGEVLRLRLAINNTGEATWLGAQLKLQYNNDTEGDWTDVNATGGEGMWRYFDGNGTDRAGLDRLFLDGSTIMEHFVESSPTETIASILINDQGEWDICIESNGAEPGETYYFRFVLSDGYPLYDYLEYPTLTIESEE